MLKPTRRLGGNNDFLSFLNKYGVSLFIILPVWTIATNITILASFVIVPLTFVFFYYRGMHDQIIILLLSCLILGDSRLPIFKGYETIRYGAVSTLFALTIMDFAYKKYGINPILIWLVPFILSAMLSLVDSPVGARGFGKTLGIFMIYFVCLNFVRYYIKLLGKGFVVELVFFFQFVLGLGILFIFLLPSVAFWEGALRYRGVFGNPNGVAAFSAFVIMFAVIVFPYLENQIEKRFVRTTYILSIASLILSASRNGVATILSFVILRDSFQGATFRRLFVLLGVFPLLFFISRVITVYDFLHFFGIESFFRIESMSNASGRTYAWIWALEEYAKHPIMGMGYTWDDLLFAELPYEIYITGHYGGVHNSFLVLLLNTGIVGLILFMMFFFRLISNLKTAKNYIPFFVSILLSAAFESWLSAALNFLNTMFLIIFLVAKLAEDEWDVKQFFRSQKQYLLPGRPKTASSLG